MSQKIRVGILFGAAVSGFIETRRIHTGFSKVATNLTGDVLGGITVWYVC